MTKTSGSPASRRSTRSGFTLVELLTVIVIIGFLVALLMPALASARRRTFEAVTATEIHSLETALEQFRLVYDCYPPSRVVLCEDGNYARFSATAYTLAAAESPAARDVSDATLAQRSIAALRLIWPRFAPSPPPSGPWPFGFPDYDGDGVQGTYKVLTGDECLVFFLGGIPRAVGQTDASGGVLFTRVTLDGLGRDPRNPFAVSAAGSGPSRNPPLFAFKPERLADIDGDGFPSYLDAMGGSPYAFFRGYAGNYDPNDCNFDAGNTRIAPKYADLCEKDATGTVSPPTLRFDVAFPGQSGETAVSPPPNPYSGSQTASPVAGKTLPGDFLKPGTFQILSAGQDGLFGVGGVYRSAASEPLPADAANTAPATDASLRQRERDNIANFQGRLD